MPKRKVKKVKVEHPETDAKLEALSTLRKTFHQQVTDYEDYLNALCEETCEKITKYYQDTLKAIPQNIRKMTVSEIMELQKKESGVQLTTPSGDANILRSAFERAKQGTEKKKTLKKEKKRSFIASTLNRPLTVTRPREPSAAFPRISRTLSESSIFTPLGSSARLPSLVVTPKFNPKLPVSRMARRPRVNEIVMSLSGSPLQCCGVENEVSLSLGGGKVIRFKEGALVDDNVIQEIDEPLKKTLESVKNQLDKILQI